MKSRITIAIIFGFLFGLFSGMLIKTANASIGWWVVAIGLDLILGFMFFWAVITGEEK